MLWAGSIVISADEDHLCWWTLPPIFNCAQILSDEIGMNGAKTIARVLTAFIEIYKVVPEEELLLQGSLTLKILVQT